MACRSEAAKIALGGSGERQQRAGQRLRLVASVRAEALERRIGSTPARSSAAPKPAAAILAGREAVRVGGMVPDEADPAVAPRQQVLGGELAAADVVDHDPRQPRVDGVDEHGRQPVALERVDLGVGDRQRDDQQPGHAVAAGEVAQRAVALLGRLDVEQHQVVLAPLAPPQPLDHAAQPLDHRRRGEERHDDADRHRPADREVARRRVQAVAELVDGGLHAGPRRLQRPAGCR